MYTIGIDIGGTSTRIGLIKNNVEMVESVVFPTIQDFEKQIAHMGRVIRNFHKDIQGIGMCAPGPLEPDTGLILDPGALPHWHGKNLLTSLRSETKIQNIKLENDANLAALGEYVAGNFRGSRVLQFFTLSTGLGAGLVVDGKMFTGFNGRAQEVANYIVSDDDVGYGILKDGSIEASCSGTGLGKQAMKLGLTNNAKELFELAKHGNADAQFLVNRAVKRLGQLIANTIAVVDPEVIVFSGSVALNNHDFIKAAFDYGQTLLTNSIRNMTKWEISKLKGLGAIYGAAYYITQ